MFVSLCLRAYVISLLRLYYYVSVLLSLLQDAANKVVYIYIYIYIIFTFFVFQLPLTNIAKLQFKLSCFHRNCVCLCSC